MGVSGCSGKCTRVASISNVCFSFSIRTVLR
jgi:hypothetical protein